MRDQHRTLHMLPADDWAEARTETELRPASLAAEGFIHMTDTTAELAAVGNRCYAGDPRPYVALIVDLGGVTAPWQYDDAARIYPHVYGPLNLDAVAGVVRLPRDEAGRFLDLKETPMNSLAPLLARLDTAADELGALRDPITAGEPWPVGAAAGGDGEAVWGPTEVLAHVSEMLTFWLGETERVITGGPDGSAHFGRTPDDKIRSLTVVRDSTLPARELFDRIEATRRRYDRRLPELTEDEISAVGIHPVRGRISAQDIIEKLVVDHLEEHVVQVREALRG